MHCALLYLYLSIGFESFHFCKTKKQKLLSSSTKYTLLKPARQMSTTVRNRSEPSDCAYLLPDAPIRGQHSLLWPMRGDWVSVTASVSPGQATEEEGAAGSDNTTLGSAQFCQSRQETTQRGREALSDGEMQLVIRARSSLVPIMSNVEEWLILVFLSDLARSAVCNTWISQLK